MPKPTVTLRSVLLGSLGELSLDPSIPIPLFLPNSEEMRALDSAAIQAGTPSLSLMSRAGEVVVEEILRLYPNLSRVLILVGPGNNGGDGLEVARRLNEIGIHCTVIATHSPRYSPEWLDRANALSEIAFYRGPGVSPGVALTPGETPGPPSEDDCFFVEKRFTPLAVSEASLLEVLGSVDLVVDAILGIGQLRPPRGSVLELLNALTKCATLPPILSIDVPTGLNADTGVVYSPHVVANHTVAIELPKRGELQYPGRELCGSLIVRGIGISEGAPARLQPKFTIYTEENLPELPPLRPNAHKGERGRILVIGGCRSMPGAPALSAIASLHAGAGSVTVASRDSWGTFAYLPPEVMRVPLEEKGEYYGKGDFDRLLPILPRFTGLVLGPGLGGEGTEFFSGIGEFVREIVAVALTHDVPIVVDASALQHLPSVGDGPECSSSSNRRMVITPHAGEAAKMLGTTTELVQQNRYEVVEALASKFGAVALLKGAGTLVWGEGHGSFIGAGSPYMATAGSGDVLSGILATILGRGLSPYEGAILGAYLHGKAGEAASQAKGGNIIASDIVGCLKR